MKVLLTGASGFVGRELAPRLQAAGHELRLLIHARDVALSADKVRGTLPDVELARTLCRGMDAVIHAAGIAHISSDAESLRRQNLDATIELAAAAKGEGVRKFIFLSSCKARYPQHSTYAQCKADAEIALAALHEPERFDVVCLRPALVYGKEMSGNLRSLLRLLARPRLPVFTASQQPFCLVSVQDLSRAVLAALAVENLPDRVYEISDGIAYTLDGMVHEVRGALGYGVPKVCVPRTLFRGIAALAQASAPLTRTAFSMSTYRTLFEEAYVPDDRFSRHTGFAVQDAFRTRLPELLEEVSA